MVVSAAAAIAFCLLGILGDRNLLVYPFPSVPTMYISFDNNTEIILAVNLLSKKFVYVMCIFQI